MCIRDRKSTVRQIHGHVAEVGKGAENVGVDAYGLRAKKSHSTLLRSVVVVVAAVAVVAGMVVAGVMFAGLSKDHSHSQICSALQSDPLALRECAAA